MSELRFIKPHTEVARYVATADAEKVLQLAIPMMQMCLKGNGDWKRGAAVAHTQFERNNPLAFFVDVEGNVYVNPTILWHDFKPVPHSEGCLSFPYNGECTVARYKKVKVRYEKFASGGRLVQVEEILSGLKSKMFQHEIDHLKGKNIFSPKELVER